MGCYAGCSSTARREKGFAEASPIGHSQKTTQRYCAHRCGEQVVIRSHGAVLHRRIVLFDVCILRQGFRPTTAIQYLDDVLAVRRRHVDFRYYSTLGIVCPCPAS
jgi:hypothetical protein